MPNGAHNNGPGLEHQFAQMDLNRGNFDGQGFGGRYVPPHLRGMNMPNLSQPPPGHPNVQMPPQGNDRGNYGGDRGGGYDRGNYSGDRGGSYNDRGIIEEDMITVVDMTIVAATTTVEVMTDGVEEIKDTTGVAMEVVIAGTDKEVALPLLVLVGVLMP
ncbi:hypothetical protein ElyMa_001198300 [Elysia marginata]|uniref:Uncharacterized protein n=1 Tax=Elysia marginata TaxID=1093978 RepID=A0AAV4I9N5_9GAST|nr:hypothetical protein ElyMa_001198300 [Elysia marginata]